MDVATIWMADGDARGARPANESEAEASESMVADFLVGVAGCGDAMRS